MPVKYNTLVHNKFMNVDINISKAYRIPGVAKALILPLYLACNKKNEIIKNKFIQDTGQWKDYRTWKKYWKILVDGEIIAQVDKKVWMISPYECYHKTASQNALITKWNKIRSN